MSGKFSFLLLSPIWTLLAAPILDSTGTVNYWEREREIGVYIHKEASGTGPTYDLLVGSYGTSYGSAYGKLTGTLGRVNGNIRGEALGYYDYRGSGSWVSGTGYAEFDALIGGTYVVAGGSGVAELRLGDITVSEEEYTTATCTLSVNGSTKPCGESFSVTFGTPLELVLSFAGLVYTDDWPLQFFEFSYSLDRAYGAASGTAFRMSEYSPAAVPEPSAVGLLGPALAFGFLRRHRRARR